MLRVDPQSKTRAEKLYPLVDPVCASPDERSSFVAAAVGFASTASENGAAQIEALDVIEHVATACARNDLPASRDLLARASRAFPKVPRLHEIDARLLAAAGRLEDALDAAKAARALGSAHAIALVATIQAQIARQSEPAYRPGMLDDALATVSIEPDAAWQLIDLTAILTTRARLLTERAAWEEPAKRGATLELGRAVYERLSRQPFIQATRLHALDMRCFDAVELAEGPEACRRAAEEEAILGAAFVTGAALASPRLEQERLAKIRALHQRIEGLAPKSTVVLVARGDESELIPWIRPTAEVIARLKERKVRLVVIDRTKGARAGALFDRIPALAGLAPIERIDAERDTFAMGCFTALAAKRKTPATCPFDGDLQKRLLALEPFGLAVLVGRDLDAEIEDLRLYELPTVLLSFRIPATEKGVDVQLKSASDAWMLSSRGKKLW